VTGLLLVAAPGLVLRALGIAPPPDGLVFLRFVGIFVWCVGFAYLQPWMTRGRRREARLAAAIETTAGFRLAVALFLGAAVATGALERPWLLVAVYDAVVAAAQIALHARGFFGDA
jgi:hypothetical protein